MNNESNKKISIFRIVIKAVLLFLLLNFLFIFIRETPYGSISLYNFVFPGRERLPFGASPGESFNLTLTNLDAMLASHKIAADQKLKNDFRIIVLGDSSIWGFLQKPENTLAGLLEKGISSECAGKNVEVFNLGYPSLSILKDLMILDKVKAFDPDLIIWFVTLESFPKNELLNTPLVKNNPLELNKIINKYDLDFPLASINLLDYTLIGQKRNLADLIRLQFYGTLWAGSGIDQVSLDDYTPAKRNFEEDESYKNIRNRSILSSDLALEVVTKGISENPGTEFILINEPILISNGMNSDIRYNFYYPRWAYDQYRTIIGNVFKKYGIEYHDFWDLIPESEFTNSAIHLTDSGERLLAAETIPLINNHCN